MATKITASLAWVLLSGWGLYALVESFRLGIGQLSQPEPGLWLIMLSPVVMLGGIIATMSALKRKTHAVDINQGKSLSNILLSIFWIFLMVAATPVVGMYIACAIATFGFTYFVAQQAVIKSLASSLLYALLCYGIFGMALNVNVPTLFL